MPAELLSTSQGQTLILTLRNPERRNAIDPVMYAAGVEALSVAESSADIRSVIITGSEGMFCSGGNLQRLQANRQQPPEAQAQSIEGLHNWIETIRTYPKPVIAAVEGGAPCSISTEAHGVCTYPAPIACLRRVCPRSPGSASCSPTTGLRPSIRFRPASTTASLPTGGSSIKAMRKGRSPSPATRPAEAWLW